MGSPAYFKRKSLLSVSVEFYRDKSLFLGILKRIRSMGFVDRIKFLRNPRIRRF
ncbi:hypothetical protein LSS_06170 [Leptospira santarosai serovar Shermani str. LT 821]|uniref:Uncharacterized protein n=1 Tax=Leptospira santarosai serovar Shermani str. LT 821 TaxID=758847 RepID=K8Y3V8_9LEPT|nr:hypothetical protein LSS_06170 [Leptospira santarosai serovar Shermani str. LT 821]